MIMDSSSRQKIIKMITVFQENQTVRKERLLELTGFTEEDAREAIRLTNDYLWPYASIVEKQEPFECLSYTCTDMVQVLQLFTELLSEDNVSLTSHDREIYILERILFASHPVKISDLADDLYVTPRQISKDLVEVRKMMEKHNIDIRSVPHYGLEVRGSEMNKRICIADAYSHQSYVWLLNGAANMPYIGVNVLRRIVLEVLNENHYSISDEGFENLLTHLMIAVVRVRRGKSIVIDVNEVPNDPESAKVAAEIADAVDKILHVTLDNNEVSYITLHLSSKRDYTSPDQFADNIPSEFNELAQEFLRYIDARYGTDFQDDLKLINTLCLHLYPMSLRLHYGFNQANPLLNEIKSNYIYEFEMADYGSIVLNKKFGCRINEDELGYLALDLHLSMIQRYEQMTSDILLVCSTGRGSAELLKNRFIDHFQQYIRRIDMCSSREAEQRDLDEYDFVFTTVPLFVHTKTPIIRISTFLGDEDIANISSFIKPSENAEEVLRYFPRELFQGVTEYESKEEAIRSMVDYIEKVRGLPKGFLDSVLRREQCANTSFGNYIAFPHPMELMTEETFCCVAINKKKINWGGQNVKVILMASIEKQYNKDLQKFYRAISQIVSYQENVEKLVHDPSYRTLVAILSSAEE